MITVLDAPFHLGLRRPADDREPGTRYAPWRLRELGLLTQLGAQDGGSVDAPPYTGLRDANGVLHGEEVAAYAVRLADAIGVVLDAGNFPLVLGGDCSILPGSALALARRGNAGLLYIDGHRDLLTPARSQHGAAAGMDLALVAGRGPEALTHFEGRTPLLPADRIVVMGHRDDDAWYDEELVTLARDKMQSISLRDLRTDGFATALMRRLTGLFVRGVERIWIHLDVDVLEDDSMYAVDSRQGGGMMPDELVELLDLAVGTQRIAGMHVTIYDPERDPGSVCGRNLIDVLVRGLARVTR
jgi:arginase